MKDIICIGIMIGLLAVGLVAPFFWKNTKEFKLGQEVQKVIDVCEEKLPRNEKCTFLIVPESKLIYPEDKLIYDEEKAK